VSFFLSVSESILLQFSPASQGDASRRSKVKRQRSWSARWCYSRRDQVWRSNRARRLAEREPERSEGTRTSGRARLARATRPIRGSRASEGDAPPPAERRNECVFAAYYHSQHRPAMMQTRPWPARKDTPNPEGSSTRIPLWLGHELDRAHHRSQNDRPRALGEPLDEYRRGLGRQRPILPPLFDPLRMRRQHLS
jgi:hypothetical protein